MIFFKNNLWKNVNGCILFMIDQPVGFRVNLTASVYLIQKNYV